MFLAKLNFEICTVGLTHLKKGESCKFPVIPCIHSWRILVRWKFKLFKTKFYIFPKFPPHRWRVPSLEAGACGESCCITLQSSFLIHHCRQFFKNVINFSIYDCGQCYTFCITWQKSETKMYMSEMISKREWIMLLDCNSKILLDR